MLIVIRLDLSLQVTAGSCCTCSLKSNHFHNFIFSFMNGLVCLSVHVSVHRSSLSVRGRLRHLVLIPVIPSIRPLISNHFHPNTVGPTGCSIEKRGFVVLVANERRLGHQRNRLLSQRILSRSFRSLSRHSKLSVGKSGPGGRIR